MASYKLINISTGIIENIFEWDGTTPFDSGSGYIIEEITGSIQWSGSVDRTTVINSQAGLFIGEFVGTANADVSGSLYGTASYANTASFVPSIKSGTSPSSSATQSIAGEYIYNISFGTNYLTNNYAVNVTAVSDLRIWTIESKSMSGFRINSNSTVATTGDVYWVAIPYNS